MAKKYPLAMTEGSKKAVRSRPKKASLKKMKPAAFLEKSRPLQIGEGDRAIINEFKKQIESGDPMGPLKLYGDGSEDGRHRAKAAQELGLGSVPVVDYRDGRAGGGPVMNVPTRLPIGGDAEALFRRLALYSYAVAPLMPGRRGYAAGGDPEVEGSVTAAPDDVEAALNVARRAQLPPMDIAGAPPAATSRATLPPMDIGRPQPEWGSASDVVRHRLDTGEKQLPQYDREAVEAWKEGAKSLGHVAAYGVPVAGPALGAYDLAMAAKEIASPEFREGVRKGDYLSTGVGLTSAALAALGAPGKAAKAAAAAGAVMMPEEARATMFGEAAKMSPQIRSALEAAKRALVSGAKPSETWMEHGWAPDPSGKMVSEISDAPARFIPEGLEKFRRGEGVSLGEILSHPELYERYPSSFTTRVNPFMRDVKERGEYNPIQDAIGSNIRLSDRDLLENLLHEHQHRVQHIERMSPGTSPDVFKGPEYHAEPLMDDIKSMQGAALLQEFINKDPSLSAFDAFERAQKAGLPIGPQPLKFIRMPYEDLKAGASDLQSKVDEIYATVPPAYEQYRRSLGEWSARMPGERLELTGPQRRWTYPYVENYPAIVRPPSSTVIENVRSPKWMRERDAALELARKLQQEPLPKRDKGGVVKALKTLGKLFPEGSGYKSVPGKPAVVALPEFGRVEARPVPEIERAASGYMQSIGRPGEHEVSSFAPFNPAFATKVGEAFERMKHDPADPAVRRAYDALIDETMAQYRAAKDTGIDFRFLKPGEADPYAASPALGYEDIVNRGRLVMFPTEQGFGSTGGLPADNPLLRRAGRVGDKENAVVNDAFRIVHDLYGHFGAGNPFFRAPGEERAFQLHSKMFSPEALPAATAETRGQNSWLNYGPYGERNRSALGADTVFAEQKIGRMPEWASAPVPDRDKDVDEYVRSLIGRAEGGEVEGYAGGGRLTGDSLKAALEMAEKFIAPTRRTVAPDESLLAMHQISPVMLPKIRDLGALPAPSIGIGKVEHDPLDFGAITLIGRPHMAIPSETNPIFGQDVWSPRVPPLYPLTPDQFAEFGGAKHALSTKEGFIPATPENIVAQMKKRPIIGGEYLTGKHDEADPELGYIISSLTPKFGSFEEMSAARDRLLPRTRANDQYVALHAEHEKLANALDRSRFNPGAGDDDPVQRLGRAILFEDQHKGSNFYDAFKTFYPGASDPQKEWFRQHVENIRNLPTSYFEAKPQRVVDFGEFGGAVVPQQKWNEVSPLLKQMGINKIMSYDQFGATMSPPGYTHSEAIRDFPELSFKSGGAPEDDVGEKKQKDIVSRALDFVSQFSPVSEAQAETLPAGVIKQLASKVIPTVKNLAREEPLFPGVYGNPREMAAEAASRVPAEDPMLKRLWGLNREDIYTLGAHRPGNAPGQIAPGPATSRGLNYAAEGIMTPENERRLIDILEEGKKQPSLRRGMMPWYYMDPVYNRLEQLFGPEEAAARYKIYNVSTGALSPGSDVLTEMNRGLGAYHLGMQGRIGDFIAHGGNPQAAPEGGLPEYMRDVMKGHAYHSTSQGKPLQKFYETGEYTTESPKVPLYIQASGVPQTGFQTDLPVPDAHYTRILGMPDVRKTDKMKEAQKSMTMGEYRPTGPWFRENVARPAEMEAVPAQALLWGTGSGATGVDTPIGVPKLEILSQEIGKMAARHRISPETARDLFLSGTLYAHGGSVIQDALDVSSRVSRERENEAA